MQKIEVEIQNKILVQPCLHPPLPKPGRRLDLMMFISVMMLERSRRGFRMACMSRLMGDDGESRVRIAACIYLPIVMMITIITIFIV